MQAPGSPLEIRAAVGMPFFPTLCLPSLNRLQQPQLDFGKLAPSDLPTWQLAALQIRPCIFLVLRLMEKGEARCLKEYIVFSGDIRGEGPAVLWLQVPNRIPLWTFKTVLASGFLSLRPSFGFCCFPTQQTKDTCYEIFFKNELGLPWWFGGKESACQCRRQRFNP